MRCEDRGPDLLAHALGQLDAASRALVDSHLPQCSACRKERESLVATHSATQSAMQGASSLPAPADGLSRLLATLGPEIESRRSATASGAKSVSSAAPCAEFAEDVVVLALGSAESLSGARRDEVEQHAASCASCIEQLETTQLLVSATKAAANLAPAPQSLQRILERTGEPAEQGDREALPQVPEPTRPHRSRFPALTWFAPLALAAGVLIAISLTETEAPNTLPEAGIGYLHVAGRGASKQIPVGADSGRFDFAIGDEVHAGQEPFTLEVVCQPDAEAPEARDRTLAPGVARLTLAPGSRLSRADESRFTLLAGQVNVSTGPMAPGFTVDAGDLFARAKGTQFVVAAADQRLVVVVEKGVVEMGRRGADATSQELTAGEQGLVTADRLLRRAADGTSRGDAFLAPRAALTGAARVGPGSDAEFSAELNVGLAGPVDIASFDASLPLFLVRLKGPDGRERQVKLQPSMLRGERPHAADEGRTLRLTAESPYELRFALPGADLGPGRWEARLRYMSYRAQSDGAEWLGVVESAPLVFEVEGE